MNIRSAQRRDLPRLTEIYNHYVVHSHVTFDTEPFTETSRAPWFETFDANRHQCWVAEHDASVAGYACSQPLKAKPAYQTSVEVSIYLSPHCQRQGIGRALYERLLSSLQAQDVHRAYALIAQPNEPSMSLHAAFGFRPVSHLTEVGRKFGRYWDVVWLEKAL
ncbi:MAG TPA: GNAT family N-acetyltransferase [Pseudomonadales bacterium]